MKSNCILSLSLIAVATFTGCSTVPESNPRLELARSDYRVAQDTAQTRELAGGELKQAGDALAKANDAWSNGATPSEVDHLAYLAKRRVAIAQVVGQQKADEIIIANSDKVRDKIQLAARTNEADAAKLNAESSMRQADASLRDAEAAKLKAAVVQQHADATQQLASDAQARNIKLEAQLKELNAIKTARGMVITIGDVLFDTNKAQLQSTGMRGVENIAAFLKQYPQRNALIEGFTDSVGSDVSNKDLSTRRADAVRTALLGMGVGGERLATQGYGEEYPVAGNDSLGGRQQNRRVEIILSDDSGLVGPR